MSYVADGKVADLYDDGIPERWVTETARRAGRELHEEVTDRTPVADIPPAYKGNYAAWIRARKGRKPGTMKEGWEETEPRLGPGPSASVSVFNPDQNTAHVEWDTRPHLIRAKRPGGVLRFPMGMRFLYRAEVHHPGTTGVHMMRDSMAHMEVRLPLIALEVLEEEAAASESVLPRRIL